MSKSLTFGFLLGILFVLLLTGDSLAQADAPVRHPVAGLDSPGDFHRLPTAGGPNVQKQPHVPTAASPALDWAKLTFQSLRDYDWEIYLADGYGYNQTRLTYSANSDADPRINHGCTRLAFDSYRNSDWEIYTMNLDGSGLSQLTFSSSPDWNPDWSPDNSRIVFDSYRYGSSDVFVMNADGSGQTQLTSHAGYDGMPAWSPDGEKIAFVSDRNGQDYIFLMDKNGSNVQQLIAINFSYHPTWSQDGTKLGFDADYDSDGFQELMVYDFTYGSTRMVHDPGSQIDALARSWSPDGRYLGFTRILWVWWEEDWWWDYAFLYAWDSQAVHEIYSLISLPTSGLDFYPTWTSCDNVKPVSAVQALPAESPTPLLVKWSGSDAGSGIRSYDVQYRLGAEGTWVDWMMGTQLTSAELPDRTGGEVFYFRSRALDETRNREDWPITPDTLTKIEDHPPVTVVQPLPEFSPRFPQPHLYWSGYDPGNSGISYYNIQMKEGAGGSWIDLYPYTTSTESDFYQGMSGKTYYFRSKAVDRANNAESWPEGDGDAFTTFYDNLLSGLIFDNRGSPVSGANLQLNPSAIGTLPSTSNGGYAVYLKNDLTYLYTAQRIAYGSLPDSSVKTSYTNLQITHDFALPPADDIIQNGHFEASGLLNWQTSGEYKSSHSSEKYHTGAGSAQVGPESIAFEQEHYGIYTPEVALDGQGTLHVLWVNGLYGDRKIMYMSRSSAGVWSAGVQIGTVSYMEEYTRPKLAVGAGGIVHVIWMQQGVNYTRRALDGTWSTPILISATGQSADNIAIGLDSSGKVHVSWDGFDYTEQENGMFYTQRAPDGNWSTPVKITNSTRQPSFPEIAVQPDGVVYAVWKEYDLSPEGTHTYFYFASRDIQGSWSAAQLVSGGAGISDRGFIQLDASNALHAIWTGEDKDIYYAYRTPAGIWNAAVKVTNTPGITKYRPKMVVMPGGEVHLIWDSDGSLFYANRTTDGTWSGPEIVSGNSGIGNGYYDHIAVDSSGGVVVTWMSPSIGYYMAWKAPGGNWTPGYEVTKADYHSVPLFDVNDNLHLINHNNTTIHYSLVKNTSTQTLLSQSVTIPEKMLSPTLSFFYTLAGGSDEFGTGLYVSLNNGLTTQVVYTDTQDTQTWKHAWVDLIAWSGQPVTINFETRTAQGRPVVWAFVDEATLGSSFPDLWLDPQTLSDRLAGEQFQYQLNYGNQSGVIAEGTLITQTLPATLTFISADPPPAKVLRNQFVWEIGTITPGQETLKITITLQVAADVTFGQQLTASYEISGTMPEAEQDNNTGMLIVWVGKHIYLPVIRH